MSDLIIKKNGTDYKLPMLAEHYPADRVYLNGDTSKTVQDECVRKTGDTMTGDLTLNKVSTVLKIRGAGSRYHNITSEASSSDKDVALPNKSGTIALTSDLIKKQTVTTTLSGYGYFGWIANKSISVIAAYCEEHIIQTHLRSDGWYVTELNATGTEFVGGNTLSVTFYYT